MSGLAARRSQTRLGFLAILAALAALAYPVQGPSSPALAHYALVKSLARGTAVIDETRFETGSQQTSDVSYFGGHYYANKAPGLAFVALPAYLALDAAGVRTSGDPAQMLWTLTLFGAVLPAIALMVLVRLLGNRLEPGFGTAAAVTLGFGTLLTPFATVFFPHALSAFLVFAAFVLLFIERRGEQRVSLVTGAGLLVGYGITTEYHVVFAAIVLGLYVLSRAARLRRGLAYSAGVLGGVMPLLLYNWWAFGSPTHLSYEESVLKAGGSGHDVMLDVWGALGTPHFSTVVSLLLSKWGLLTTAPVLAMGIAGAVVLYRRGNRAEMLVIAAIGSAYLLYSAAFFDPFGSVPPGPRYLIPMIPFLALPLVIAFRAFPAPTAALAAVSVLVAGAATATRPHIAWDGDVLFRLVHPSWWSPTVADLLGVHGWYRVLPLLAAFLVAVGCAALDTRLRVDSVRSLVAAALAVAGWALAATQGTKLLTADVLGSAVGGFLLLCGVLLLALAVALCLRVPSVPPGGRSARVG